MTNEEKLEFIKANYKFDRTWKNLPSKRKEKFLEEWINTIIGTIPLKLYKYRECNEDNLSALKNKQAWFSSPSTWNDPIDVTVPYNLEKDLKLLDETFDDYVLKFAFMSINSYIDSFCKRKKHISSEKVKAVYYSCFKGDNEFNPKRMIAYLTPVVGNQSARRITIQSQKELIRASSSKFKQNIIKNLKKLLGLNDLKEKFIMYSLSETYSNNHQWAMYASRGEGYCVEYKIFPKSKREISLLFKLLPIYYGERKELLLTKMLNETMECVMKPETLQDLINREVESSFISFHTKAPEWNGEQEWRFDLSSAEVEGNLIDFDFATAIYLGENIGDEWKHKLIDIAKEQKLDVYQRKLDKMKSNWIYEKISL